MADQLAGHWYRKLAGRSGLLDQGKVNPDTLDTANHTTPRLRQPCTPSSSTMC